MTTKTREGTPPGLAEFHLREALAELFRIYGRPQALKIVNDIISEESHDRKH